MADRPSWIRPLISILAFVLLGAVVLAATAWLVVRLLPDGEAGPERGERPGADVPGIDRSGLDAAGSAPSIQVR